MKVIEYDLSHRDAVLDLSIRAWEPVFAGMRRDVPRFVYDSFYPEGWQSRQRQDLATVLEERAGSIWVAVDDDIVVGWVAVLVHPEDSMGEVHVLAVDPDFQRRGVARLLLDFACDRVRDLGMNMVMVETGDDSGHAASRATYEANGFQRWPVARYFKDLSPITPNP